MTAPTGKPRGRPRKDDVTRTDGNYANVFLGKGTSQDRSTYTRHAQTRRLDQVELENIYQSDGLAKKIIDLPCEEMVRCGFEIEEAEDIFPFLEAINVMPTVARALKWSDLFGGSMIVMIVNDGGTLEDPLNENNVREVESLRVYDRWQTTRFRKYTDPADKRYGKTELYMISPVQGGNPYVVHESRCIIIDGIDVPDRTREQNDGWGNSKLQHIYDQLVKANDSHYWANGLMERAQQAVHSIPGLTNILRAPGGENLIRQRVDLVDMSRSVNNAVVIDGEESYDIRSTSFASIADIIDRLTLALCAVSDIPEQLLFGRQQSGINSNGNSSLENWYAKVGAWQRQRLLPILDRLVTLVLKSKGKYKEDYTIEFHPLWVPSEKEEAETSERKAKTAEIYVNMGALDPSEVRKYIGEDYDIEDVELMPEMPGEGEEMPEDMPTAPTDKELAEIDLLKAQAENLRRKAEVVKTDAVPVAPQPVIISPNIEIKPQNIDVRLDMPEIKQPNITVNMPEMVAPKAPDIIVNVPKQDAIAPVVNINNDVKPSDVNINIPLKKTVTKVTRDENGEMTGSISVEENK